MTILYTLRHDNTLYKTWQYFIQLKHDNTSYDYGMTMLFTIKTWQYFIQLRLDNTLYN